jgi:hypothetical protein
MKTTQWVAAAALCALLPAAQADVLTQWNFNSPVPDGNTSTGTLVPHIGAGTASLLGTTGSFASGAASGGSTDPAPSDNSGWQTTTYAPQGTEDRMRGVQFAVSTAGYRDIVVSWDQRHSNTSARHVQFQYSLDGTTFTNYGATFAAGAGDTWFNNRTVDLGAVSGVADNALFAFRIVAAFAPDMSGYLASSPSSTYGSGGTWRFDMVTVQAAPIPEPGTWALLLAGMAAMGLKIRRRT